MPSDDFRGHFFPTEEYRELMQAGKPATMILVFFRFLSLMSSQHDLREHWPNAA
jgi:hypothetical protein